MKYRLATSRDVAGIFAILEEVASEIPLTIRDDAHRQQLLKVVGKWCALKLSKVAVNGDGLIVGFQIASKTAAGKRMGDANEPQIAGLTLEYAGVTKGSREQRVFPTLIDKMKHCGLPLYATVKHSNHCAMADRLVKMGFEKFATDSHFQQDLFRWLP